MQKGDLLRDVTVGALATTLACSTFALIYLRSGWPHNAEGPAAVTDAGALIVDGQELRLAGVASRCLNTQHLADIVGGRLVRCTWRADRRDHADCRLDGTDLSRRLLEEGVGAFSGDAGAIARGELYLRAEFRARMDGSGIWGADAADCEPMRRTFDP